MPVDGFLPLAGVVLCAAAACATRAVKGSGALAGAAVGAAIVAGAGWRGFAMLAALLVCGTLASARGSRGRDARQVLSNSGVAALAALAGGLGASWGLAAAAGALAAALSDTVSGELGRRWGGRPRVGLLGRPTKSGADGGMTWLGTLLGVPAATLVPVAGWLEPRLVLAAAAAGVAGNLADSALGATVQRRLGPHGNDWVNVGATATGALVACAFVS